MPHPTFRHAPRILHRLLHVSTVALLGGLGACAPEPEEAEPPALVVLVTVDQLRGDLIERYEPVFTGGFRRLMDEGRVFTGASHNHSSTSTAIGHTTLATGRYPATHGITGNSWGERLTPDSIVDVYAVADSNSPILDYPTAPGRSPAKIWSDALADWLLTQSPESRTLSVSTKDRAAITTAGQSPEHNVYWWMPSDGRYVTSAYYRSDYPDWVLRFNRERIPQLIADSVWEHPVAEAQRSLARADDVPYEADGRATTFTHLRSDEVVTDAVSARNNWWRSTPFADRATLSFVQEAMAQLELGTRGVTDYLSVAFSATDYVGHKYGPLSQEQLANLHALDQTLAELFDALDAQVGEGNWVLGLSADHGVLTTPEYLPEIGEPGYRVGGAERRALDSLTRVTAERALAAGADTLTVRRAIAEAVEALPFIADVMVPEDELLRGEPADSFVALFARSYTPGRLQGIEAWDLPFRAAEGVLFSSFPAGTSHGSPYWYDRWVPVVFMGPGIEPGTSSESIYTVDVAPTLAALAGISAPTDLDGRILNLSETR
jgi:predicted AlkP superfamily pyrophosphatase or phosphodiesterase